MIKVRFENLVINSLIVLKEKYDISRVTSSQLDNYKKSIFKNLKTLTEVVNIDSENPDIIKEKYSKFIKVKYIFDGYFEYSIKDKVDIDSLKKINVIKECDLYNYNNSLAVDSLMKCIIKNKDDSLKSYKNYNKLVRDNIPGKLIRDSKEVVSTVLNDKEYKRELYNNLSDIYNEFMETSNVLEKTEKGADLVSVLSAIVALENNDEDLLLRRVLEKEEVEGNFDKRLFLERIYTEIN